MKTYIVCQMIIDKDEFVGANRNILMSNIVRRVYAETEAEAIGKFTLATSEIKANKKLDIQCIELNRIIEVL